MGWRVQAVTPASANDAAMIFRNCRRFGASVHSDAPAGNSRCSHSLNSGVSAAASRLRQYCGPSADAASLARNAPRSSRAGAADSQSQDSHAGIAHRWQV